MPRFFKRRPFRRFRRRPRGSWVTDIFASAFDMDALAVPRLTTIQSWFERDDFMPSAQILQKTARLRVVHSDVTLSWEPAVTGTGTSTTNPMFRWALFVADTDDLSYQQAVGLNGTVDALFNSAPVGSLLQGGARLLRVGQFGLMNQAPNAAQSSGLQVYYRSPNIAIRWRGNLRMGPDDAVLFAIGMIAPTGDMGTEAGATVYTLSRCYVTTN